MSNDAASFVGNIPQYYDQGLGPMIFVDYAADIAQRAAAGNPARVLETAAGTGIVTRKLRDALPAGAHLTAADLNPSMLDLARSKFRSSEQIAFQPADATALLFADGSFDAVVCQFGLMFFPDKPKSYSEVFRVLAPRGRYIFSAVLLPSDRSDQGGADRDRLQRHQRVRDQTGKTDSRPGEFRARGGLWQPADRSGPGPRRRRARPHRRHAGAGISPRIWRRSRPHAAAGDGVFRHQSIVTTLTHRAP